MRTSLRALVAGLCVAFSLPPWGWWPLTFLGIALYAPVIVARDASRRSSFRAGFCFGVGWFTPSLMWMWFLTIPGYVVVVALFSAMHGTAALVGSQIGHRATPRRATAVALAHTLVEALRFSFPFGGIPLASIAIAQSSSPLARLAPLGGVIAITYATFRICTGTHRLRVLATIAFACAIAPLTAHVVDTDSRRVAIVQGGGPQGTHAVNTDSDGVFQRHLQATQSITLDDDVDMVIWPENVVDVEDFVVSTEFLQIAEESRRLSRPVIVGVTESMNNNNFTNAQVVVTPGAEIVGRYDKKRRVPFGEYVPLRGILSALGAPTNLVPRNAVAGQSPAVLNIDGIPVGVVISWEVFFGGRANEGVAQGAQLIINPTNGSSYTWTILQSQQIASSKLRAREQSRWVVQVAPTGFSGFISPSGKVVERTKISEQRVVIADVNLRQGRTLYSRIGNSQIVALFVFMFLVVVSRDRRQRARNNAAARRTLKKSA